MNTVVTGHFIQKTLGGFVLAGCLFLTPNLLHAATMNSATFSWAPNSESDLAGYNFFQGTTSGSYGPSVDVGNRTTHTALNLQAGLTYYFAVTAYDTSGNESLPSLEVSKHIPVLTSDTTPPSIPTGLVGTMLSTSDVALSWKASTDNVQVAGYQVMRNNVPLATTITPSYQDSGISSGFTYTYTVEAFDQAGNTSAPSAPVSITLSPSTSTLLVSIVGSGTVTSSPTGIRCPSNSCSASYGTGSTVTLTAKADKRWKFSGWSGACRGVDECVIQLSNDQIVEATFSQGSRGRGKGGGKGGGPKK